MKLPGARRAVVDRSKVRDYLLSTTHSEGRDKAVFFLALGYRPEDWKTLARDLRHHACDNEASIVATSPFGRRFEVRGRFRTRAERRRVEIVTVWILASGDSSPRLVTAYPRRRS
jgi:uncharacterized protein DUF6883